MGRIDDLNADEVAALVSRIDRLERQAPIGFSTVSRGAFRIISSEGLIVEGSESVTGTLEVSGVENVDGTLNVSGTLNVTGEQNQVGPLNVTGESTFEGTETHTGDETHNGTATNNGDVTNIGKTTQTGEYEGTGNESHTGDITNEGTTTQKGDLQIASPGVLKVGAGVTITPFAAGGGRIDFNPGGRILGSATTIILIAPDGTVNASVGNDGLTVSGYVSAQDLFTTGGVYLRNLPTISGVTPNLYWDSSDQRLKRIV